VPDDSVEARVTSLEQEVARLREQITLTSADAAAARGESTAARADSAAARVLAAGADRDVSDVRTELRAHTQALNALRETQLEQGREMRDGFATVAVDMAQITALLTERNGSEDDS
jgi:hypothetical protein